MTPSAPAPAALPYAFAKAHGVVLLGGDGTQAHVGLREGADARALLEVRRALARPLRVE
ncbi:type II secretion system protein GspE, partial [Lysobacter maris]